MASIISQIASGLNPFSTVIGSKIEQATDENLETEDWDLTMQICALINQLDDGPRDAMKAIRKRLQHKSPVVIMHTLVLLQCCAMNCGRRFVSLATQKDFVQELVRVIGPKNDPPVSLQNRVLSLIQRWARAFPDMAGVVQVYNELKQKGIEFPSTSSEPPTHPHPDKEKQDAKLRREVGVVKSNMGVLEDMLTHLTPQTAQESDTQLMEELYQTCLHMQSRIMQLIDRPLGDEKLTEELLCVNDELNRVFGLYQDFHKRQKEAKPAPIPQAAPLVDLLTDDNPDMSELDGFSALAISRSEESSLHQNAVAELDKDIGEVCRWLEDKPEDNTQFERFLESRAAAAEKLPSEKK